MAGLAALARSTRQAFLPHPAAAAIAATRPEDVRNIVRIIEAILALLERAGFSTEQAARTCMPFGRLLLALIVLEASLPELSEEERRRRALRTRFELESFPAEDFLT